MNAEVTVRPLNDRVLVRPDEPEGVSRGGIVIPDSAKDKFPALGTVLAVGPGRLNADGTRTAPAVAAGDRILYGKYAGTEVEVGGRTLKFISADDILAALDPASAEAAGLAQNVKGCARCGRDHKALPFFKLSNAADEWEFYATCPDALQPVLMRFVPD